MNTVARRVVASTSLIVTLICGVAFDSSAVSAAPSTRAVTVTATPKGLAKAAQAAFGELETFSDTGDTAALERLDAALAAMAAQAATALGIEPVRMQQAWASADVAHLKALLGAMTQLGVPYRKNTSVAGRGFDCSGLTSYAWKQAGVTITRQSRAQIQAATAVSANEAQAGDLVYYPGHVSIYLGVDRAIVHSVAPGRTVELGHLRKGKAVRFGSPIA